MAPQDPNLPPTKKCEFFGYGAATLLLELTKFKQKVELFIIQIESVIAKTEEQKEKAKGAAIAGGVGIVGGIIAIIGSAGLAAPAVAASQASALTTFGVISGVGLSGASIVLNGVAIKISIDNIIEAKDLIKKYTQVLNAAVALKKEIDETIKVIEEHKNSSEAANYFNF